MKNLLFLTTLVVLCLNARSIQAQVVWDGTINYWLTNPRSFSIGNAVNGGANSALLNVRGDQLTPAFYNANLIRTVASPNLNAYWRLYGNGTTATDERGQLYSLFGETHFNINSPNGALRFHTSTVERMRLYPTGFTNINGFNTDKGGFLGLSPGGALWSGGNPGVFSRLHLDDGGSPITGSYRDWMRNGVYMSGNNDMMYMGQLFRSGYDESDAVLALW